MQNKALFQTKKSIMTTQQPSSSTQVYIPRHLLSAHLNDMVSGDYLNRFLGLESSKAILGCAMKDVYGDDFSKLVYDCVYYYEQALVEEQTNLYQSVRSKLEQYRDNQEEDAWAKEHQVFIGDESGSETVKDPEHYKNLLKKLDQLNDECETKLPSIGDKSTLVDVLDDLHSALHSAENFKNQLLSLLKQESGHRVQQESKSSLESHHRPHAHLKYNNFNTMIGSLKPSQELFSCAKEFVQAAFARLEKWQVQGLSSVEGVFDHSKDACHSPVVDTKPYNAVLNQYMLLFYELYRRILDSFRCVTLFAITVADSERSDIVYIGSTTDIKKNFAQFSISSLDDSSETLPMLEVCAELLNPKFDGLAKKIHLFTIDERNHRPIELNESAPEIIKRVSHELIHIFSPPLNKILSISQERLVDASSLNKIHTRTPLLQ